MIEDMLFLDKFMMLERPLNLSTLVDSFYEVYRVARAVLKVIECVYGW